MSCHSCSFGVIVSLVSLSFLVTAPAAHGRGLGLRDTSRPDAHRTPGALIATEVVSLRESRSFAERLGTAVATSSDGRVVLVGAALDEIGGQPLGSVRVFERLTAGWDETATLVSPTPVAFDGFGETVAVSADGATALVGSPNDATGGVGAGAAFVFVRRGASWSIEHSFYGSVAGSRAGQRVALSADGSTALIAESDARRPRRRWRPHRVRRAMVSVADSSSPATEAPPS